VTPWLQQLWRRRPGAAGQPASRPLLAAAELADLARLAETPLVQRPAGEQPGGEHASPRRGHGLDFQELRRYQAGDDVRAMDWRTTARTGTPHVRVHHLEPRPCLYLLVDLGETMRFGTRVRLKAAQAARIAVYQALATAREGGTVGATVLGEARSRQWPVRGGRDHALALARGLAGPCPPLESGPPVDPGPVLAMLPRLLPVGAGILVLSDLRWLDAQGAAALGRLAAGGRPVTVARITDTAERSLPPMGRVPFRLPGQDSPLWLDTARPGVRAGFDAHAQGRARDCQRWLQGAGVRFLDLGSETPARIWTRQLANVPDPSVRDLPRRG